MEKFISKLTDLLSVKSILTISLTFVFCCLALRGNVNQDFMTIYMMVIAFYFGKASEKGKS